MDPVEKLRIRYHKRESIVDGARPLASWHSTRVHVTCTHRPLHHSTSLRYRTSSLFFLTLEPPTVPRQVLAVERL
jgi:hypothetical protein